jgi:hypothetical protein
MVLSATEEAVGGTKTDLSPAGSADDLNACKAWEATLARDGRR